MSDEITKHGYSPISMRDDTATCHACGHTNYISEDMPKSNINYKSLGNSYLKTYIIKCRSCNNYFTAAKIVVV